MQATRIAIWILMGSSFAIAAGQTTGQQPVSRPNPEPGSGAGRGVQGERLVGRADVSSGFAPYVHLIPVLPQGLTAPPYPSGTRIQENRIEIPGGVARRVWLEGRMGRWGLIVAARCDGGSEHNAACTTHGDCPGGFCGQNGRLNLWEVVVDPATFANGFGADLLLPEVPCGIPDCDNAFGIDHSSGRCHDGFCDPALIQPRPDRVPMDIEYAAFWDKLGVYCAGTTVATPPTPDDGLDWYGGTFIVDLPPNARGTYVIDFVTETATYFEVHDGSYQYITNTSPAIIKICDPGACESRRTRFLSILPPIGPNAVPAEFAIRVSPVLLPQFPAFAGAVRWAGPPVEYPDGSMAGTTLTASRLGCEPHVQDWSAIDVLELFGPEVVPSALYEVRFGDADCALSGEESCLSAPAFIWTAAWGDVMNDGDVDTPNFADINAVIDNFRGSPNAISTVRAKLYGNVLDPSASVNFQDIFLAVNAFRGLPYPYAGPSACP